MSGKNIQKTIDKGLKVAGKVLGFSYSQYRPLTWVEPIQDENFLGTMTLSFSPDDSFNKDPHDDLEKYRVYGDSSVLSPGDILVGPNTYMVINKAELRPAIAVLCGDSFDLLRPVLAPSGPKKTAFEQIAASVPCTVGILRNHAHFDGALQGMNGSLQASLSNKEVWTFVEPGLVQMNDVLQIYGVRYLVMNVFSTNRGTQIFIRAVKPGQ